MAKKLIRDVTIVESDSKFSVFKKTDASKYDFSSISSVKQLLSNEKARMLHIIKSEKPMSIYDLAKKLGRTFKGVSDDVYLLKRFGFIDLLSETSKKRQRLRPVILIDEMTINIKI